MTERLTEVKFSLFYVSELFKLAITPFLAVCCRGTLLLIQHWYIVTLNFNFLWFHLKSCLWLSTLSTISSVLVAYKSWTKCYSLQLLLNNQLCSPHIHPLCLFAVIHGVTDVQRVTKEFQLKTAACCDCNWDSWEQFGHKFYRPEKREQKKCWKTSKGYVEFNQTVIVRLIYIKGLIWLIQKSWL